jgi:predicted AlkP superfamily phosphohydrolase/phosphomutase
MTDTIILGLDGATWDVLDPLLEDGCLPELRSLIDEGQADTLESTFPPITAPAWLSMATGQNPGKTGVFYFLNRDDPDSFEFESLGSDSFQGKSFWDILAARGHSVGVFNFPMLYPPYELGENGFMVSGLGSPGDDTITQPHELKQELNDITGGYEVKVPYADPKYQNRPGQLASDLHGMLEKREAAMTYLLEEKRPDVFFGVISVTDWAQHYFWRYHDHDHALYDPDADKAHRNALKRLWERVDETIGTVAEFADRQDANLLLVSDHGFGPVNQTFYSNSWLEDQGLRVPSETSTIQSLRTRYFPYLRRIAEPIVSAIPQLNDLAKSVGKSIRGSPGDDIDWDRSVVFAPRQNLTCGMLYMLSDDSDDKKAVIDALESLTDATGDPVETNVFQPEERYEGPKTDLAPDILFTVEDFACAVDPRYSTLDEYIVEGPPSAARSGGHRMEGIYVASGPQIESGEGMPASIFDIAPTLLYALGEPIPDVIDGEPLTDLFISDFRGERSVEWKPLADLVGSDERMTERDTEAVQDRLEDLGYI